MVPCFRSQQDMPLSDIPDVDIDPSGTFKYILIKCTDKTTNEEKQIVRGYYKCTFHADILSVAREAAGPNYKLKCLGGGRIRHEDDAKEILVYGYSQVRTFSLLYLFHLYSLQIFHCSPFCTCP
ncbi:unnamed protein product [Nippostrongylus brasiliensis]|uniref:Sex-regulated protein janus-A (inferred by orthology to a D. melanogaster protein) n=1 Tax=Nippostrongylus brasiliensis TaxID=27835 RepID=A0A0N4YG57_NIPBR|nr:unnamed protein product [Nippostrongylus brasiliensis]